MIRHGPSFLLLGLLATAPAAAQTVWTVTAQNGIQAAINAASPGDVVVLPAGFFGMAPFVLDRGLTIVGNGASVGTGPGVPLGAVTVMIPPGQVAHLDQVNFTWGYSPFGSLGCSVTIHGDVRIDRCSFFSGTSAPALAVSNGQAVVVGSTIRAVGRATSTHALHGIDSHVVLRDCTITGSDDGCPPPQVTCTAPFPATSAGSFSNCSVHAERTSFAGGNCTVTPAGAGAPGIAATNCVLWLAYCTVSGGNSTTGAGGTALQYSGTTLPELRNTQLTPGTPGGLASSGPVDPTASLLSLWQSQAWTLGQTTLLAIGGDAGAPFALLLTPASHAVTTPLVVEPVLAAGAVAVATGLLDPGGLALLPVSVPNVASLQHAAVWCQAVAGWTLPLRASTMAGGVVR